LGALGGGITCVPASEGVYGFGGSPSALVIVSVLKRNPVSNNCFVLKVLILTAQTVCFFLLWTVPSLDDINSKHLPLGNVVIDFNPSLPNAIISLKGVMVVDLKVPAL
jgi:hypothetical protein